MITFLFSLYVQGMYFNYLNFFMLYENFYYIVFTRYSAGKIWSSICIQDFVLHEQINPVRQVSLTVGSDEK